MTPDEELIMSGAKITAPDCRNCGKPFDEHMMKWCGPWSESTYEAMDREDYLEREGKL